MGLGPAHERRTSKSTRSREVTSEVECPPRSADDASKISVCLWNGPGMAMPDLTERDVLIPVRKVPKHESLGESLRPHGHRLVLRHDELAQGVVQGKNYAVPMECVIDCCHPPSAQE